MSAVTRTILQLVLINDTGDSFYRMRWPGADLAKRHPDWRVINLAANAQERFAWGLNADLLVLFQSQDYDLLPLIKERTKRGLKTIAEYNDNFYDPPAWSPVAQPWSSPLIWQSYETIMDASDALMVTGPGLVELFTQRTKTHIDTVPNYFPSPLPEFDASIHNDASEIRIGWAGSLGHMADILALAPLLKRLIDADPRVRVHLMGNETLPSLMQLPAEKLVFSPWGTMEQYFAFWKPIHIGIAPLLNTGYNRCRSDIKAIEMSGMSSLPLLQHALPYEQFLRETRMPGFSSLDELEELLSRYVSTPALILEDTRRCYDYVANTRRESEHSIRSGYYSGLFREGPIAISQPVGWPEVPGYYEIAGTPEPQTQSSALLNQVQALWNQQKRQESLNLILRAMDANPLNPDWNIAGAKCLSMIQHPALAERIAHHRTHFPRDIRIALIEISAEKDLEQRKALWLKLLETLERDLAAKSAFQSEVIRMFTIDLRRHSDYLDLAFAIAKLYPNSPEIRLPLAEMLERTGHFREALIHFDWLSRAHDNFDQGKAFFQGADRAYVKAWSSALRSRLHASTKE